MMVAYVVSLTAALYRVQRRILCLTLWIEFDGMVRPDCTAGRAACVL